MRHIKTFESKFGNRKYWGFSNKCDKHEKDGLTINVQPGFESSKEIDLKIDEAIKKILDISLKYNVLVNIDVYSKSVPHKMRLTNLEFNMGAYIKFRISDIVGSNTYGTDGNIPLDIKLDIVNIIHKYFDKEKCDIDEFEDRGYLVVEIEL